VPDRRAAKLTLGEWVEEYLDAHAGERVTVAKLRWLPGRRPPSWVMCALPSSRRTRCARGA
jgi:hypothetical protein